MSGNLPAGQPSGFLSSFMSFLGGGGSKETSTTNSVKTPVLPKYIPEVKHAQKVAACEDSLGSSKGGISEEEEDSEDESFNDKIGNDQEDSEGSVGNGENGLVLECEPECDVPELPPVHVKGGFLNRTNVTDSQTDDNAKGSLSSGKDDYTTEKTPPILIKESGKRQRSQSGRRMRTRQSRNKDSDEEKTQDSSSSSVEVQEKVELVSPIRRQSTRRAKQKIEQRRVANIKKGKRLLSLYTEISDSNDSEVEMDAPSANASGNEDDDSDKDPAWTPVEQSSAKRPFGSDNDDEHYGKRKRGRQPSTPKFTPQKTPTAVAVCTPQIVTPKPSPAPQPVIIQPSIFTPQPVIPKPSPDIPIIQRAPTTFSTPLTPLAKKGLEDLLPLYQGPPESDSPHSFQKGDYVLERKDLTNCDAFPIWKIDSGRLLQKFEPVERNGRKLHQSMSVYSSWIDQIHFRFKAIEVLVFSAQRGKEVVEVLEKYRPKPAEESVTADQIKEPFNIYIQIMVSQTLEPTFLSALFNEKDKYYMDPLNTIDEVISKCVLKLKKTLNWKDEFQKSVDQLPKYESQDVSPGGPCQAFSGGNSKAEKLLRFFGCVYHRDTLFVTEELEEVDAQEYEVGKEVLASLPTYHGLQHFKMNLLKKCQVKVNEIKVDVEMEDHEVLDKCLLDHTWITELLDSLVNLVQSANA